MEDNNVVKLKPIVRDVPCKLVIHLDCEYERVALDPARLETSLRTAMCNINLRVTGATLEIE